MKWCDIKISRLNVRRQVLGQSTDSDCLRMSDRKDVSVVLNTHHATFHTSFRLIIHMSLGWLNGSSQMIIAGLLFHICVKVS